MSQKESSFGTSTLVCIGLRILGLGWVLALALAAVVPASAATGKFIAHNTPKFVATAKNLGPVSYTHLDVYKRQGTRSRRARTRGNQAQC